MWYSSFLFFSCFAWYWPFDESTIINRGCLNFLFSHNGMNIDEPLAPAAPALEAGQWLRQWWFRQRPAKLAAAIMSTIRRNKTEDVSWLSVIKHWEDSNRVWRNKNSKNWGSEINGRNLIGWGPLAIGLGRGRWMTCVTELPVITCLYYNNQLSETHTSIENPVRNLI